ncbi:uncharacterized protein LOC105226589 isoform X1 [Bactrocera dorsalis]|uniref:Uncharacterized protein LOC105226589 isoform X1 n=1 Tax=Bactrocera dorsalis TaxID=27457 RepID=A0A6I9V5C3_BACDO|nr:uncharacterized protein LOC105226589 isoform X1 [Bactrocera dorsalis]
MANVFRKVEPSQKKFQSTDGRKSTKSCEKQIFIDRRIWTKAETRAFLNAYISRKDEFRNVRQNKFAMQNVLSDLESQGVFYQTTTVDMLSTKFRNLVKAYRQSIGKRKFAVPCIAPFMDLMDEIFSNNARVSKTRSIMSGQPPNNTIFLNEMHQTNFHLGAESEEAHSREKQIFSNRRIWTSEEIEAFLNAYISRKEEFRNKRKKKFAMQNVLHELESQGALSQPTTVKTLSTKLKNLIRAYKYGIDNNSPTNSLCKSPYEAWMKEIFADNPNISINIPSNSYEQSLSNTPTLTEDQLLSNWGTNVETDYQDFSRQSALCNRDEYGSGQENITSPKQLGKCFTPLPQQNRPAMKSIDKLPEKTQSFNDKRIWTKRETRAFLKTYISRKREFSKVRKKKFAMQNVLQDLQRKGVLSQHTTVDMLSTKLKNLGRAYKQAIENSRRTKTPVIAPFGSLMEEIYKDDSINCNNHTISKKQQNSVKKSQTAENIKDKPLYEKEIFSDKRIWTNEETEAFLHVYISRKEEFRNVRRKKFAMQNVLSDLESQGVLSQTTTVDMLSTKFRNLVKAYRISIGNTKRKAAVRCIAPFTDLMDEIFSNNARISKSPNNRTSLNKIRQNGSEERHSQDKQIFSDKRFWTIGETEAFLCAYISRKDEFLHVHKKKFAMQNVLLDLESQGVLRQPTTVHMLKTKLKNLARTYKQSVDNKVRDSDSGSGPCADLMEEVFGGNPIASNEHIIYLCGQPLSNTSIVSEEES